MSDVIFIAWPLIGIASHIYCYARLKAFDSALGAANFCLILPFAIVFGPFMAVIEGLCVWIIEED